MGKVVKNFLIVLLSLTAVGFVLFAAESSSRLLSNTFGWLPFVYSDSELASIEQREREEQLDAYAVSKTMSFIEQVQWIEDSVNADTGGVSSFKIDSLRQQVMLEVDDAYRWIGFEGGSDVVKPFPEEYSSFKDLDAICSAALKNLEELKALYDAAVEEERELLTVLNNVSDSPEGERVRMLAASAGVSVPVYYSRDSCPNGDSTNACYWAGKKYITVTPLGFNRDDAFLTCVLRHEDRHAQQDVNGQIEISSDGVVLNREWLEQDALNYAGC